MPMTPFYTRFRDLAFREMRSATTQGWENLPDGEYGFLELYCDEKGCDCRRVIIDVIAENAPGKILAVINYGWEDQAFYDRWMRDPQLAKECKGPVLDVLNPQSQYAPALLRLFETVLLQDEAYVRRLARHYELFKGKGIVREAVKGKKVRRHRRP